MVLSASEGNSNKPGIRPNTNKLQRIHTIVPWFKAGRMFFPTEWRNEHPLIMELEEEVTLASASGLRSRHDDVLDTLSMLSVLKPWKPTEEAAQVKDESGIWMDVEDDWDVPYSSYIV